MKKNVLTLIAIMTLTIASVKAQKAPHDPNTYFETYFMPGVGYTYYQPTAKDSLGTFSGLAIEYLLYGQNKQTDNSGPSHVRFYSKLNILKTNKENISSMFMYAVGLDLSIEKNPKRNFLIPYFGLEFGGISQKNVGSTAQFTPILGVHLLSRKNFFLNVRSGYVYPIANFEILQGWFGQIGLNFSLW
jgi:hypothetical protein